MVAKNTQTWTNAHVRSTLKSPEQQTMPHPPAADAKLKLSGKPEVRGHALRMRASVRLALLHSIIQ